MSFVVILIMWVNHHELLRMMLRVDYPILFANGLLLLTTALALVQPWLGLLLNVSLWALWIRLDYRSA